MTFVMPTASTRLKAVHLVPEPAIPPRKSNLTEVEPKVGTGCRRREAGAPTSTSPRFTFFTFGCALLLKRLGRLLLVLSLPIHPLAHTISSTRLACEASFDNLIVSDQRRSNSINIFPPQVPRWVDEHLLLALWSPQQPEHRLESSVKELDPEPCPLPR